MNRRFKIPQIKTTVDIRKFHLLEKKMIVSFFFTASIFILYLGSLHPWFMWVLKDYYKLLAGALALFTLIVDNSNPNGLFTNKNYIRPTFFFLLTTFVVLFVNGNSFSSYVAEAFAVIAMLSILKMNKAQLEKSIGVVTKTMACFLVVSLCFFLLYLLGFSLPSRNDVFGDNQYSYTNYYFFMVDDRSILTLIPRFHSVFLEPGHLGGATSLLLMTQFGRWNKWYNIVLLFVTIITFSLAAYAFLFALVFLNMWVQRKNIIGKVVAATVILTLSVTAAFFYNNGDNMFHDLILLRLEIDEKTGDISGNNRVSEDFEKEFESYMSSSDVFFGRDFSKVNDAHGNSGYRVYIYENGLVATVLVFLFYVTSFWGFRDIRFLVTAVILASMVFWVRGYPVWYSNFIPILVTAFQRLKPSEDKDIKKNGNECIVHT